MLISGWWILLLAIPVVTGGEWLTRRLAWLSRFHLPAPIVGGLLVALVLLVVNSVKPGGLTIGLTTDWRAWAWIVEPVVGLPNAGTFVDLHKPLMVAFFTCVGLNASWAVARVGSWQLLVLLLVATGLAVLQNVVGVAAARAMHVSPYVGLLCGSVTLTGGPGTAMGFASTFEQAGFAEAKTVGLAAATFGIVAASLLGGPTGSVLIRVFRRSPLAGADGVGAKPARAAPTFLGQLRSAVARGKSVIPHLLLILACVKVGAFVSPQLGPWLNDAARLTGGGAWLWNSLGLGNLQFPVYIGAMLFGIVVRNALDLARVPLVRTDTVNLIASVLLGLYLTFVVMTLDLMRLRGLAGPMLAILLLQVAIMLVFAAVVTFPAMGLDYQAAVASAGHVGFGLGVTPNAVANMEALAEAYAPAPRAMLVVTLVGGFLLDVTNSITITYFLGRLS